MNKLINIIFYSTFSILFLYSIFIFNVDYNVDKITLKKDNQTIVLQGMIHVAPEKFYNKVIQDKKEYEKNNYNSYYELIKSTNENKNNTHIKPNIKKIINRTGWQNETSIAEINNSTNLDISLEEFENLLNIYGLTNRLISPLNSLKNQGFIKGEESFIDKITIPKTLYYAYLKHNWLTVNQLVNKSEFYNDIIIKYRNQNVVNHLVNNKKNSYVTYGNKHIKGIVNQLVNNGYSIEKQEKIFVF